MDWFDALTSTAWMNSHTLSVSGGTEKSSYVASAGYHNEDGCLQPQFYKRYNLRAAVDVTPNDYFKFGVSLYGTFLTKKLVMKMVCRLFIVYVLLIILLIL